MGNCTLPQVSAHQCTRPLAKSAVSMPKTGQTGKEYIIYLDILAHIQIIYYSCKMRKKMLSKEILDNAQMITEDS